ncbi:hypothetical protein MMC20_005373 [Loxospora ochrophaea]|nr:hypothetical protein [Loxospora ochrophaea]
MGTLWLHRPIFRILLFLLLPLSLSNTIPTTSPTTIQLRIPGARPITACASGTCTSSMCTRASLSARTYVVICSNPDHIEEDSCSLDEICVHRRVGLPGGGLGMLWASCISHAYFVDLAQKGSTTQAVLVVRDWQEDDTDGDASSGTAVQAVLTGSSAGATHGDSGLKKASWMQIQAQAGEEMYNTLMWRTLAGGVRACVECGSVELMALPRGTRRVQIDAVFDEGSGGGEGRMYVAEMAS